MKNAQDIAEIISQYTRHGWKLRRVLLTSKLNSQLTNREDVFGDIAPIESEIDALWFSRAAKTGGETWELRSLGPTPLALLEVFDESDAEEIREPVRVEMQERLLSMLSRKTERSE